MVRPLISFRRRVTPRPPLRRRLFAAGAALAVVLWVRWSPVETQSQKRQLLFPGALLTEIAADQPPTELPGDGEVAVIARLDVPSLAAYQRSLQGGRFQPTRGRRRLAVRSPQTTQHLARIRAQQHTFERSLQGVAPNARVGHRLSLALNAVSFSAPRTAVEAIASLPGVVGVYPDTARQLQTTRTPALIGATALWNGQVGAPSTGAGIVVGLIDSGIWPEHPSFADAAPAGPSAAPAGWRGMPCAFGSDAPDDPPFACNNKILGARRIMVSYDRVNPAQPGEFVSARDESGHGTLVASIAAGNSGVPAAFLGNPLGSAAGVAPAAQLAVYKVCGRAGCYDSDAVAAVEQAIVDGVDIIHLPLSGGADPYTDPLSLALLDAYNAGIFVVTAAGNNGLGDASGRHEPWSTTVGATRVDRTFASALTLRAGTKSLIVYGASATPGIVAATPIALAAAAGDAACAATSPAGSFTGRIVVCQRGGGSRVEKSFNVRSRGGVGMILINPSSASVNPDNHYLPTVHLDKAAGDAVLAFLSANTGVTATFTRAAALASTGDVIGSFTSRGGAGQPLGISKPDLAAPGVQILGGHTPRPAALDGGPGGETFQIVEGTSLASAHVAGAAALLLSLNPTWSPDHVKSALMLTATTAVKKDSGAAGDQFDFGSGRVRLDLAARPGIAIVPGDDEFVSKRGSLWDVNYPAVYVPRMPGAVNTRRTLQNLENSVATWNLQVVSSAGFKVTVPSTVTLPAGGSASIAITLDASAVTLDYVATATITLAEAGGGRILHLPIAILRKDGATPLSARCAPVAIRLGEPTDCTIDVFNAGLAPSTVTVYDVLPSALRLVPGSIIGAVQSGNAVVQRATLEAALPGGIDIRPTYYEAFLPLAGYYPAIPCSGSCDDRIFTATIPSGILFNGVIWSKLAISTNGFVQLGGDASAAPGNQRLPDPWAPNSILAPFWTDLHPAGTDGAGGGAIYAGYASYPSGRTWLVIEWNNVISKGTSARHTFQVWLQVGGQVEDVTFSYFALESLGAGGALTVGAENPSGNEGASYYFNGQGTAPVPQSNLLVSSVEPAPGGSARVSFRATGQATGTITHCAVALRDGGSEAAVSCLPVTIRP